MGGFLPAAQPLVAAKQLPATQASTLSGLGHGARLLLDPILPRRGFVTRSREILCADSHRRFRRHRCRCGIVIIIPPNAEKRSRSRWNRVHVHLESAFIMRWKP
jgi:hypothetical protein